MKDKMFKESRSREIRSIDETKIDTSMRKRIAYPFILMDYSIILPLST
jgi:hypothetical protein